jgi:hypothetical protein
LREYEHLIVGSKEDYDAMLTAAGEKPETVSEADAEE